MLAGMKGPYYDKNIFNINSILFFMFCVKSKSKS